MLAIQSFYAETSTAFTDAIAATYLLGEQPGSGGLFDASELAPLSAVLFSNSGTVAQFNRIGKQLGYGTDDVWLFRFGFCLDTTPAAVLPREFWYEVGTPSAPPENFGQSLHLIHNPNADHPLSPTTLTGVRQTMQLPGQGVIVTGADGFVPFASHTFVMGIAGK